jgi:hypothetical protein
VAAAATSTALVSSFVIVSYIGVSVSEVSISVIVIIVAIAPAPRILVPGVAADPALASVLVVLHAKPAAVQRIVILILEGSNEVKYAH